MTPEFEHSILISAVPEVVWSALTDPLTMRRWMGEPEMEIEVQTGWAVGGPFVVRGFLHARFENQGIVLCHQPAQLLRYSHLSSLSRLPDQPESYSVIEFRLEPTGTGTSLTVRVSGFPTESIFKHLVFYWRGTLSAIKRVVEGTGRWPDPLTVAG